MTEGLPPPLAQRAGRLAAMVALGAHADVPPASIDLACDLIVAGIDTSSVVDVAALDVGVTWRDSGAAIEDMLAALGFAAPSDDDEAWQLVLRAFGFSDLPLAEVFWPFLTRLPSWDRQSELERALVRMLDDWDHATDPADKASVVARMREAVREHLD